MTDGLCRCWVSASSRTSKTRRRANAAAAKRPPHGLRFGGARRRDALRPEMKADPACFHRIVGDGPRIAGEGAPLGDESAVLRRVDILQIIPRHHMADQVALGQGRQLGFAKRQAHHRQNVGIEALAGALAEEMHVRVAAERCDDGAIAAGEFADVLNRVGERHFAERHIKLVHRIGADATAGKIAANDGVGDAWIDIVGTEQEEAPPAEPDEMIDRRQRLLLRCCAGIDHMRRLLLAFVLARIKKQAVIFRQHRQHLLARSRRPAAENRRDLVIAQQRLGLSRIGANIGARVHDGRLDRPAQQAAGFVELLDQHDEDLLQRPLAAGERTGKRMQNTDLDRAVIEICEVAAD